MQNRERLLRVVVPHMDDGRLADLPCCHDVGERGAGADCQADDVIIVLQIETLLLGERVKDDPSACRVPNDGAISSVQQVLVCIKATVTKDVLQGKILR